MLRSKEGDNETASVGQQRSNFLIQFALLESHTNLTPYFLPAPNAVQTTKSEK